MPKRALTAALAVCLFLLIVGAKWATFDRFGSPMPDWDQWDAEALELFIPWFENDHFTEHLFHPHNEHRVVLTKLQNLTLGLLNGQWDSRLEAATNAMLHAALAVAFWLLGRRWLATNLTAAGAGAANAESATALPRFLFLSALLFVLAALLFGLPLAWQNILGGFHSQQFWLLGLSFAAIVTLPFAAAGTRAWWIGLASAVLVLGSMGSGFLAAVVVVMVLAWRWLRGEARLGSIWATLLVMAGLIAVGLLTRFDAPWHANLKAATFHDFFQSIIRSLQWPLRDHDLAGAVLWLPWVVAGWRVLRADRIDTPANDAGQAIVALGGWTLIQIVATAYARGAGGDYPASRYMDTLGFGAMANAAALVWLLAARPTSSFPRYGGWVMGLAWLGVLGAGLHEVTDRNLRSELPDAKKYYLKAEGNMRRFLATNDPKQLAHPDIPFPDAQALVDRLARPSLRALMPVPIRAPLVLTAQPKLFGFSENDGRDANPDYPPHVGISPKTPPLDAAVTWGSYGTKDAAEWRSELLFSRIGAWLKFETAGQIGEPGLSLELQDARTGQRLAVVQPTRVPGDSWRAAYVRAPREPFILVARDTDSARWVAFSGPVEMGWLSYWAWQANRQGLLLVYIAAGATVIFGMTAWLGRGRQAD